MSDPKAVQGLTCPKCGGIVPIPEGVVIVRCPYCELRSVVRGEHGLRRYQVPLRVDRQTVANAVNGFLGSNMAIAMDARGKARISEMFVAYLPFWAAWARAMGWVFGEREVGSGDSKRYEPREVRIAEDMSWNGAACDVGEFGVGQVPISDQQLEPYNPDALHRAGLVFEPVGSTTDADGAAKNTFQEAIRSKAGLSRISQAFTRMVRARLGLVYFPLWIARYLYRGRAYQVVVDGYTGKVLYGKAPGNTLYRAAILVGGMAAGALVSIDIPWFIVASTSSSSKGDNSIGFAIAAFLAGIAMMWGAYRAFRYGEQYEYHSGPKQVTGAVGSDLVKTMKDAASILEKLS